MNEHEIRERIHLVNLELSGIMGTVGIIVSDVNMRRFGEIRMSLSALEKRMIDVLDLIDDLIDK